MSEWCVRYRPHHHDVPFEIPRLSACLPVFSFNNPPIVSRTNQMRAFKLLPIHIHIHTHTQTYIYMLTYVP